MIPNVFVSSTVADLHHLREVVRDLLREIGYNPVLSEHGDIGYGPGSSAEDACYSAVRECQLAVVIVGKRYGAPSDNGLSVTQNESRVAREARIPIITLVEQEVLSFKRVFDANPEAAAPARYPGMDHADKSFAFIQEVTTSPVNNGIISFSTAADARDQLKKQLAHLFGDLLRNRFDPLKADIRDAISEIKTLRHELLKNAGDSPQRYLQATRYILDEAHSDYRRLLEALAHGIDAAIPVIVELDTFENVVQRLGSSVRIVSEAEIAGLFQRQAIAGGSRSWSVERPFAVQWCISPTDQALLLDAETEEFMREEHATLRKRLAAI